MLVWGVDGMLLSSVLLLVGNYALLCEVDLFSEIKWILDGQERNRK